MTTRRRRVGSLVRGAAGAAAVLGLAYVTMAWHRLGRPPVGGATDPLLDRFMPTYDVRERHETRVMAPAPMALDAACAQDLQGSWLLRTIFRGRELLRLARREAARRYAHAPAS